MAGRQGLGAAEGPPKTQGTTGKNHRHLEGGGVACPEGLEPPTCCLEGSCSIQLSYGQTSKRGIRCRTHVPAGEAAPRTGWPEST